jgi:hypothetical protein
MYRSPRRTLKVLASITAALAFMAMPSGASAAGLPDVGRVKAWWPLAEGGGQTINDWSGYGNQGFLGSTPQSDANDPAWVRGIFNTWALNFGGDDYVTIPGTSSLNNPVFSVSLWVRAAQSPGQFKYLISKGSNGCGAASYGLTTASNGGLMFYVWDGQNAIPSGGVPPEAIWDGKWHNVVATWNGSAATFWLDGKDKGTPPGGPNGVTYTLPDTSTTIGGYNGSACQLLFSGDIDQVMIFDKVIPVAEIWQKFGWLLNKPLV